MVPELRGGARLPESACRARCPDFGLNYKDNPEAARRWIQSKGNPYVANILDPDGRLGLDLGVTGAPETYLIDGEGVVHLRHQGPVDERVWRKVFVPALAELDSAGAGR